MKRLFSVFLSVILISSCMPTIALAEGNSTKTNTNFTTQDADNQIAHLNGHDFGPGQQVELTLNIEDPDGALTLNDVYTIPVNPSSDEARKLTVNWLGTGIASFYWQASESLPGKRIKAPIKASFPGIDKKWIVGFSVSDPQGYTTVFVDEAFATNILNHNDSSDDCKNFAKTGNAFNTGLNSEFGQLASNVNLRDMSNLYWTETVPDVAKPAAPDIVLNMGNHELNLGDTFELAVSSASCKIDQESTSWTFLPFNPASSTTDNYKDFNTTFPPSNRLITTNSTAGSGWAAALKITDSRGYDFYYIDSTYAQKVRDAGDEAAMQHKSILQSGKEFAMEGEESTAPTEIDMSGIYFSIRNIPNATDNRPGVAALELQQASLNKSNLGLGDIPRINLKFNREIQGAQYSVCISNINPATIDGSNKANLQPINGLGAHLPFTANNESGSPIKAGQSNDEGWIVGFTVTDALGFTKTFVDSTFKSKIEALNIDTSGGYINPDDEDYALKSATRIVKAEGAISTNLLNGLHYSVANIPGVNEDPNPPRINLNGTKMNYSAVGPGNAARLELDIADNAGIKTVKPLVSFENPATMTTQSAMSTQSFELLQQEEGMGDDANSADDAMQLLAQEETTLATLGAADDTSSLTPQATTASGKVEVTLEKVHANSKPGKRWLVGLQVEDSYGFITEYYDTTYATKKNKSTTNKMNLSTFSYEVTSNPADGYDPARAIRKAGTTVSGANGSASSNIYRLYNRWSGEHFYTVNETERAACVKLGWKDEGVAAKSPAEGVPVYRLYNKWAGDHHFTTSVKERDFCISKGWTDEGIAFKSNANTNAPVYRLYNPYAKTGTHHFTASTSERDYLKKLGWRDEGTGWYGA